MNFFLPIRLRIPTAYRPIRTHGVGTCWEYEVELGLNFRETIIIAQHLLLQRKMLPS